MTAPQPATPRVYSAPRQLVTFCVREVVINGLALVIISNAVHALQVAVEPAHLVAGAAIARGMWRLHMALGNNQQAGRE